MELSSLNKTWIIDVDGTIVKHNGYLIDGYDTLLEGVKEFFGDLPPDDKIVLMTARKKEHLENLKNFLSEQGIRYDYLLTDMPMGERILINDKKTSGLKTAYAINLERDSKLKINYKINNNL